MPFNVICLGCTAVALAFGGLHNLTTKEFQYGEKRAQTTLKQRLNGIRVRLLALLHARTRRNPHQTHEHSE